MSVAGAFGALDLAGASTIRCASDSVSWLRRGGNGREQQAEKDRRVFHASKDAAATQARI
jgi:hypothetical protein